MRELLSALQNQSNICRSERSKESFALRCYQGDFLVLLIYPCGVKSDSVRLPHAYRARRSRKRHCLSAENSMAFAAYIIHINRWKLFQFFHHYFRTLVNVTATECDYDVAFFCIGKHIVSDFLKAVEPHASGNLLCKVLCVNSVGIYLS